MKLSIDNIKKMMKTNMGSGISWNLVSVIFFALAGITLQLILIFLYSPETLGIFGLAMAYYTAISQVAVLGIHFSVLKYVSQYHEDQKKLGAIMGAASLDTAVISIVVTVVSFVVIRVLQIYNDSDMLRALVNTLPALFFFSMNKVLLNYFNGLSKMKAYAFFQSLRNVLLMISLAVLAVFKVEGTMLTWCYAISEATLFLVIGGYILYHKMLVWAFDLSWAREHVRFGFKIIPGNLVLALNVRVDVMCLGAFGVPKAMIGFYTFAAQIAEGFYQIIMVIRRNINPRITQHYHTQSTEILDKLRNNVRKYTRMALPPLAVLAVGVITAGCFIFDKTEYLVAILPLFILLLSMSLNGYWLCFGNAMNQTGFPQQEAWLNVITLVSNVVLNLMLIPFFGLVGAAIATAMSYCVFSLTIYFMLRKKAGYRLSAFRVH